MSDIVFTPKLHADVVGFGDARVDPDNPDKVIVDFVLQVEMPDPKRCVILKNVSIPDEAEK